MVNTGRRADLTPTVVRALPSYNSIAGTARLADGTKVREMRDASTGEIWYVDATPSATKVAKAAAIEASLPGGLFTTPEEDFGTRTGGGSVGEPA